MRTLLFLGLALGAAFMANWFTIERDGDRTRIDINRDTIRSDAQHAVDKGREMLDHQKRELQTNMPPAESFAPATGNWPVSGPVQNTGFSGQGSYGNPPPYSGQNYQGQPANGQPYGGQAYENQSPPSGYGPNYPASAGNPPPWQR